MSMQRRSGATVAMALAVIGLVLLPALVNVATTAIPASWQPYRWLLWPVCLLLAATVGVVEARRAGRRDDRGGLAGQLGCAVTDLAEMAKVQWRSDAAVRSLSDPGPIWLTWRAARPTVAARPEAVLTTLTTGHHVADATRLPQRGTFCDLAGLMGRLPNQQLVVLGPPGCGKSGLARLLTLELLDLRDCGDPVPVLLAMSSWNPRLEPLTDWMAGQLREQYPALRDADRYGPSAASALVAHGRVLPVLDGLDEIDDKLQSAAIEALGRALAGGRPYAVTSRTQEYQRAVRAGGRVLANAYAVEIDPADAVTVADYLARIGPVAATRWAPVIAELRAHPGGVLAEVLSTPLMVGLARTAYELPGEDPAELIAVTRGKDRAAVEHHLLAALLPSVYPSQPQTSNRPAMAAGPEQATAWLAFLARHMTESGSRELAWWQLHRAVHRAVIPVAAAAGTVVAASVFLLLFGLIPALRPGFPFVAIATLIAIPVAGVTVGVAGPPPTPARMAARWSLPRSEWHGSWLAAAAGVGAVLGLGVFAAAIGPGLVVGAVLVVVMVGILLARFESLGRLEVSSPSQTYRDDRRALRWIITTATGAGTVMGILVGLSSGAPVWVAGGLAMAFAGAVVGAVIPVRNRPDRTTLIPAAAAVSAAVVLGLVGALAGAAVGGRVSGLPVLSVGGVLAGLGLGILGGLVYTSSGWLILVRACLCLQGRLPWRVVDFLDDAHHRQVLRQVGARYQFRHARVQDHLIEHRPAHEAPAP
jgi:hypothetical protein